MEPRNIITSNDVRVSVGSVDMPIPTFSVVTAEDIKKAMHEIKKRHNIGEKKMEEKRNWEFVVRDLVQIDNNEIFNILTRANPMIILKVNKCGSETFRIYIHKSLVDKRSFVDFPPPTNGHIVDHIKGCIIHDVKDSITPWVKWAKAIKRAPWPKACKDEIKVLAIMPRI